MNNFIVLPNSGKVAMKEVDITNDLKLIEFPNLLDGQLYNNIPFIHNNYFTFVGRVGYDEFGQSFILNENQNYSVDTYNIYNLDINRYNELNDTNYVGFKSINLALKNMTYSASQDNFITESTYNYNIMRLAMNTRDIQLGCFGILNPVEFWQDNHTTFKIALNAANLIISAVDPGTLGTIASTITNNVVQKTTTRHYPSPDPDHPGESPGTEMKNRIEITVDVLDYFETSVNSFPFEFDIEDYNTIHQTLHAGVRKIKLYSQGGSIPQLESNIVLQTNGQYILGNNDADDELEIYQSNSNRARSLPASIGTFVVNVPQPLITQISNYQISNIGNFTIPIPNGYDAVNSISGNVDVSSKILSSYTFAPSSLPSTFNIQDYNNSNNTDYIGVSSITCTDINIQPQPTQIIINNINIQNIDSNYVMKIAVGGRYSITDQTYSYLFLILDDGFYYFYLVYKISSVGEIVITNNTNNKMRVFRISNASSPKNILFRYYNGSNYTNIVNVRTPVNGYTVSYNVNELVTSVSFNQSYYDMSSFF